jgi:hypothetical protein
MDFDDAKLQNAVLALLGTFAFENGRAWKRYDFSVMEALHKQGFITDPRGRSESVYLTEEGQLKAKELAATYFGAPPRS